MSGDTITILPIPLQELVPVLHSDASLASDGKRTQAGYILGFSSAALNKQEEAPYSPFYWKSYKLKRVVSSTLASESQALREGMGHLLWMSRLLAEACDQDRAPTEARRRCRSGLKIRL